MRLTVDLTWDANQETDLAGYKITWGDRAILLGKDVTELKLSVLVKPKTVYEFTVQAFDVAGNESAKRTLTAVYVEG